MEITGTQIIAKAEPTTLGARPGPASGIHASRIVPPLGWVRLEAEGDRTLALLCRLGEGNLDLTQGIGGWDEVDRPGRTPISRWRHRTALKVDVPLWMNNRDRTSVESQIQMLTGLAGRGPKWAEAEPPHLIFDTAGVSPWDVQAYPDQRWVIDALTWGSNVLHNQAGNRYRQDATVTLLQFVDDVAIPDQSLARRAQQRGKVLIKHKTYRVKAGDTLVSVARRELGSVDRWLDLLPLNPAVARDPRRELKSGTTLRLR
jgi:hypothetical protein